MLAVKPERVRTLSADGTVTPTGGGVVYWMSRDQRVQDNWAMLHAKELALKHGVPLSVVFCLVPTFQDATIRHYGFMLRGLEEVERELRELKVPFSLLQGWPSEKMPGYLEQHEVCALVTDFSPLRVPMGWKRDVVNALPQLPVFEVDAHNIVPVWAASPKLEVGARTLRPKVTTLLPEYLTELPKLQDSEATAPPTARMAAQTKDAVDWEAVRAAVQVDRSVGEVDWCVPGTAAGLRAVESFCDERLKIFADKRNDPNVEAL